MNKIWLLVKVFNDIVCKDYGLSKGLRKDCGLSKCLGKDYRLSKVLSKRLRTNLFK